jgi:hypothetical protein
MRGPKEAETAVRLSSGRGVGSRESSYSVIHGNGAGAWDDQPDIAPAPHFQNLRFDNPFAKSVGGGVRWASKLFVEMRVLKAILLAGLLVGWCGAAMAEAPVDIVTLDSGFHFLYDLDFDRAHQAFAV